MCFEQLYHSAKRGELLIMDGGMCHWHLRRNGQITIREIIVTRKGQGVGAAMLETLKRTPGATSVFAKCPVDLNANQWYAAQAFKLEGVEVARSGRHLNLWRLTL